MSSPLEVTTNGTSISHQRIFCSSHRTAKRLAQDYLKVGKPGEWGKRDGERAETLGPRTQTGDRKTRL